MSEISIIVPVYNAESTLRRCVDSILSQTFSNFELILVNDGSKDSSGAICDEYVANDVRVKVIHKENRGVSSARNAGLDVASGEWVTFCDSDDFVEDNYLESLLIESQSVDLVISGAIAHSGECTIQDVPYERSRQESVSKAFPEIWNNPYYGTLWGKLFKRDVLEMNDLRLDEQIKFREDEEFLLRFLCKAKKITILQDCLYHYIVPDWSKYDGLSNFIMSLSVWESAKIIGCPEQIEYKFLKGATQSLFFAYEIRHGQRLSYLKRYRKSIGSQIQRIEGVSKATKQIIISIIPNAIVSILFDLKSLYRNGCGSNVH